jgi:hypothetical protein
MSLEGAEKKEQTFDVVINLGGDCQVAYQLSTHGLRSCALPFDGLITPYDSLKELLKNSFEDFMTPENFELMITKKNEKYILDKKYKTRLLHDFKMHADFLQDYEAISSKYVRRIERLMGLIGTSEYPLFVRKRISREQARDLKHLLEDMRKGKPFLIVALDDTPEIGCDWNIEGVRNYYLRQPKPYTWKGDTQAWKEIFERVGLKTSGAKSTSEKESGSKDDKRVSQKSYPRRRGFFTNKGSKQKVK